MSGGFVGTRGIGGRPDSRWCSGGRSTKGESPRSERSSGDLPGLLFPEGALTRGS